MKDRLLEAIRRLIELNMDIVYSKELTEEQKNYFLDQISFEEQAFVDFSKKCDLSEEACVGAIKAYTDIYVSRLDDYLNLPNKVQRLSFEQVCDALYSFRKNVRK